MLLSTNSFAITVVDDTRQAIVLNKPAQRIVSLAPNLTELIYAAGAGRYLIGVDVASDYPAAVKDLPIVSNYQQLNLEAIVALQPDLIVAWVGGNSPATLLQLQRLGYPVFWVNTDSIQSIPNLIKRLGQLAATTTIARQRAKKFQQQYYQLKQDYAGQRSQRIFYQLWSQPLMTVGADSIINQVINLCGGKNIFANIHTAAATINIEAVIVRNPQIIISSQSVAAQWQPWLNIAAVKKQRFVVIHADLLQRYGPRLLQGVRLMCEAIKQV